MSALSRNCGCGCGGSNPNHNLRFACGRALNRVPQYSRQVHRDKTPPPIIERHVERVPTPDPDVIEKITVKPQPQRINQLVIERPKTPPPVVIEKEVVEEAPEPKNTCEVKDVENSGRDYSATVKLVPAGGCGGANANKQIGGYGRGNSGSSSYISAFTKISSSSGYQGGDAQSYYEYLKTKHSPYKY